MSQVEFPSRKVLRPPSYLLSYYYSVPLAVLSNPVPEHVSSTGVLYPELHRPTSARGSDSLLHLTPETESAPSPPWPRLHIHDRTRPDHRRPTSLPRRRSNKVKTQIKRKNFKEKKIPMKLRQVKTLVTETLVLSLSSLFLCGPLVISGCPDPCLSYPSFFFGFRRGFRPRPTDLYTKTTVLILFLGQTPSYWSQNLFNSDSTVVSRPPRQISHRTPCRSPVPVLLSEQ